MIQWFQTRPKGNFYLNSKVLTTDKRTNKDIKTNFSLTGLTVRSTSGMQSSGEILELPGFECFSIL